MCNISVPALFAPLHTPIPVPGSAAGSVPSSAPRSAIHPGNDNSLRPVETR